MQKQIPQPFGELYQNKHDLKGKNIKIFEHPDTCSTNQKIQSLKMLTSCTLELFDGATLIIMK